MRKLIIILDPAHGSDVPGKRSPNGKHLEYRWSREICKALANKLLANDFRVEFSNNSEKEIGLSKRVSFANHLDFNEGEIKFLVSLHNNAAGNGSDWMNARGVEIYTSKGSTRSDEFAEVIMKNLKTDFPDNNIVKFRYGNDQLGKEANFSVLMGSTYYAVLLEWLFQDNKEDYELLQNYQVNSHLVDSLVKALIEIDDSIK